MSVPRARLAHVLQDVDGDIQASKAVTLYEDDGVTPYAGTLYNAITGGSVVLAPASNSLGLLDLYVDPADARTVKLLPSGEASLTRSAFYLDPTDILRVNGTQTRANGLTITTPVLTTPTVNSGATLNGTVTANNRVLVGGRFGATGIGPDEHNVGLSVLSDGRIGMCHSGNAANDLISAGTLIEMYWNTQSFGDADEDDFNLLDVIYSNGYKGTPVETGSASSGGAGSLGDGSKSWTVNAYQNLWVRMEEGALAGEVRKIASNNSTALTLTANWSNAPTGPAAGDDYTIFTRADHAAQRLIHTAQSTFAGDLMALEITAQNNDNATVESGFGASAITARVHASYESLASAEQFVVLNIQSASDGATEPTTNVGALFSGNDGFHYYLKARNTSNTEVFHVSGAGIMRSLRATIGTVSSLGVAPLVVLQTVDSPTTGGGLSSYRNGSTNDCAAVLMGSDGQSYLATVTDDALASLISVGGATNQAALHINSIASLTANLFEARVGSGSVLALIRADGLVNATVKGLSTYVNAGALDDSAWGSSAPPNGTIAIDSSNNRIYARVGGTWRYAALT